MEYLPITTAQGFKRFNGIPGPYYCCAWIARDITAFADAGSGDVKVMCTAHGKDVGDTIAIEGTVNYDGSYVIQSKTDNTFNVTATWVVTETGTWNTGEVVNITKQSDPLTPPTYPNGPAALDGFAMLASDGFSAFLDAIDAKGKTVAVELLEEE